MKIFNTLSKQLDEFVPIDPSKKIVTFYHCGPTVYWVQHIGNMRGMTMADLVRRVLEFSDFEVKFVRNYTDVGHLTGDNIGDADSGEDRMEKGAKREGLSPDEIAQKYIDVFEQDLKDLNHLPIDSKFRPRATEYISQMQEMVQILLDKNIAYLTPKAVYFDITKKSDYTKLSRQKLEFNKEGAGVGDVSDADKKNPQDFAIWFFKTGAHANALQTWQSPFHSPEVENGRGFPGWHIECSAMAKSLLGETIDIHMGGVEHIPVHHTNEIAQSECTWDKVFVNYWLHNEHLMVDGGKMAKSEGTAYSLSDIKAKGYDPMDLRYFFLNSHYRSKQNFTWEALEAAKVAREKIVARLKEMKGQFGEPSEEFLDQFSSAINNDFNLPEALAVTWNLLKSDLPDGEKLATVLKFDKVLGLKLEIAANQSTEVGINPEVEVILADRKIARESKDWAKADALRDKLKNEFGLVVKDTENGQVLQ